MNAGGVPNTCKSSGKALHRFFDSQAQVFEFSIRKFKIVQRKKNVCVYETLFLVEMASRKMCVKYTSGGRLSNA